MKLCRMVTSWAALCLPEHPSQRTGVTRTMIRAIPRETRHLGLVMAAALLLTPALPFRLLAQDEQPSLIVRDLAIQGHRRVQEAVILGRVQTRVGSPFVTARVADDVRAIFALGFFQDVQVKVEEFEGGVKLTFVVVERPFIRDIELAGNRQIDTRTLQERLDLKLGAVYDPVDVQRAAEKLRDHYEEEGYFEVQIKPEAETFPDGDLKVVFRIEEGPRITIDRIVIDGARGLSERQVKSAMHTRERRFFVLPGVVHRRRLEADMERILALYQDHGYLQARVEGHEVSVDRIRRRATITIKVVEGPQFTVGTVDITGTTVLPVGEIRRQITLAPGQVFSRSKLRESILAITSLYGAIGRACAEVRVTLEISDGLTTSVERVTSPTRC